MNDGIFDTIKAYLDRMINTTFFDNNIVVFINDMMPTSTRLGIGPFNGFKIAGLNKTFGEHLGTRNDLDSVKTYIYMKVRMAFDPPSSSAVMSAYKEACHEFEWRPNVAVEG